MKKYTYFAILFLIIIGCKPNIIPPKVKGISKIENYKIGKEIQFDTYLNVENQNKKELNIQQIQIEIFLKDNKIADAYTLTPLVIPNGINEIGPITIIIPFTNIPHTLNNLSSKNEITFKGYISIKEYGITIPFNINHKIEFRFNDILKFK
jgi:LEA14-like dessication related protein